MNRGKFEVIVNDDVEEETGGDGGRSDDIGRDSEE